MRKGKVGLQKEISKIFTGIQLPKKDDHKTVGNPAVASAASAAPPVVHPTAPPAAHPAAPTTPPAHYIPPKPVASPPRHFTIPEPAQNTPQTPVQSALTPQAPVKTVYEPPTAKRIEPPVVSRVEPPVVSRVEPPIQRQNFYEPPPIPVFNTAQTPQKDAKSGPPPKRHLQIKLPKTWQKIKTRLLSTKPGVNPARQKTMIVLVPALLLVMVFLFARTLRTPMGAASAPTGKTAASAAAAFDGKIDWELPPLYPENLRDPTTFGNVVAQNQENAGKTPVRGIVYSDDNPCAVVGDRIVSVGDVVNGATVVKINLSSVEFADGDKKWSQEVER